MPNAFQLLSKTDGKPTPFARIDEQICAHLNEAVHPVNYYRDWYDIIGFAVAIGRKLSEIATNEDFSPTMREIARFLSEHYTERAWCER